MLALAILVLLVVTAAATDLSTHRIYNWTTYSGILAALTLSTAGWLFEAIAPDSAAVWRPWLGWIDLSDCVAGFFACGMLMLVCFVFFPTGGGDVKLLAMVGALAGVQPGLEVLLWTFVFGGCVGLTVLIWRMGPLALLQRAWQLAWGAITLGAWVGPRSSDKQDLALPVFLGPCAAAALAAVLLPWPKAF
jgi:prepilin peptidase CpaA